MPAEQEVIGDLKPLLDGLPRWCRLRSPEPRAPRTRRADQLNALREL